MLLVSSADFATYNRDISQSNLNSGILNQHIQDAQFIDVKELMGSDFYFDMIRNSVNSNYVSLLEGGDYTYNGKTYTNVGLKSVIVYYAYARYLLMGGNVDTPFSFVNKDSDNSTRVPYNEKKAMYKINKQTAFSHWENVQRFIQRNITDYPLYYYTKNRTFKISRISGKEI